MHALLSQFSRSAAAWESVPPLPKSCRNAVQSVRINGERVALKRMPAPCSHFRARSVTRDRAVHRRECRWPLSRAASEGEIPTEPAVLPRREGASALGADVKPFRGSRRASLANAPGAGGITTSSCAIGKRGSTKAGRTSGRSGPRASHPPPLEKRTMTSLSSGGSIPFPPSHTQPTCCCYYY